VAVPKRKMSRSNTRSRRSQWKATPATLTTCPRCRAEKLPHVACPACGAYKNRSYPEALRPEHETR
jgi:large subunit ribosomal protein L32